MEIAMIAEGEQIELQTLRLHHSFARDIHNLDFCEVWLTSDGTQRRKLGAVKLHPVVVVLMLVLKRFQHLRCIRHLILSLLAQQLQAFIFSCHNLF